MNMYSALILSLLRDAITEDDDDDSLQSIRQILELGTNRRWCKYLYP